MLWASGLVMAMLLMLWTRYLHVGWLAAAGILFAPSAFLLIKRRDPMPARVLHAMRAGYAVLLVAIITGIVAHSRFEIIEWRWPALELEHADEVARTMKVRMAEIEARATRAARGAAVAGRDTLSSSRLLNRLDSIQRATGVDAIAVLANSGELVGWAGSHRGPLPEPLRTDAPPVYFTERALFSYLYFSVPIEGVARHAVAAVLVETGDIPSSGFAASFRAQVDSMVSFHAGHPGTGGPAIWSLVSNGDTIVHARALPITQIEARRQAEVWPRILMMLFVVIAFVCFGRAWIVMVQAGGTPHEYGMPMLFAIPLLAMAPLTEAFGSHGAYSLFVDRYNPSVSSLVAVIIPIAAFVSSMRRRPFDARTHRIVTIAASVVTAIAFAISIRFLLTSATPGLRESDRPLWFGLQLFGTLLLSVIAALLMPRRVNDRSAETPRAGRSRRRRNRIKARTLLTIGSALCVAFGAYVASSFDPATSVRSSLAMLWGIPFACFAFALADAGGRSGAILRWVTAGFLAASALVPQVWDAHVKARLIAAEEDLATLGTNPDPFIDYLLEDFGEKAVQSYDAGEDSVRLLYGAWVESHLAEQPFSAEIMLWSADTGKIVQLGTTPEPHTAQEDSVLRLLVDSTRARGVQELFAFTDKPHMSHVLMVPLGNGEVITVIIPPRRTLDKRFGVASFLGGVLPARTSLYLVEPKGMVTAEKGVTWRRTDSKRCQGDICPDGWRSETVVQYPDGPYHAHLTVAIAPFRVRVARAMLIIAFDMLILLGLWVAGTAARGVAPLPFGIWKDWSRSFRARITIALFIFFLVPTMVFGWVAYRALAQEVERATQLVAERAAEQAAAEFPDETASLVEISSHTDTDVLRYHGGELIAVSSPEALELGVYGAWMPPRVYSMIEAGEETSVVDVEELGSQRLLTAYHALQASGTLGVPMPLISGDTADRQSELAHVILFAALIGALLSVALSLVVGRALAGPINRLTRASTAVGAGRLGVRLPGNAPGEFGQLFDSFNQMVRRLRRARSRELRTARVLAWGEMARQVAHEIKNPLTPIKLAVQHMRRAYNDKHPDFPNILESNVSQILVEIDHLSEISTSFSRYGAPAQAAGPLQPVEVAKIVHEAMTLYRTGDDRLQYREQVSGDLPAVLARPGELKEVLFNLIENARAAIEEKGTITVNARVTDGQIYVEVVDTGSGISDEMLPRIFDPHFSTRSSGTGLGLAIVRRLVESWGGTVEAESKEGTGTTVCVRLLPADLLIG